MIIILGRELNLIDFGEDLLKSTLHLYAFELISFKLGVIIDMTRLKFLKLGSVILTFTQGHRVTRNLQHV